MCVLCDGKKLVPTESERKRWCMDCRRYVNLVDCNSEFGSIIAMYRRPHDTDQSRTSGTEQTRHWANDSRRRGAPSALHSDVGRRCELGSDSRQAQLQRWFRGALESAL